MGGKSQRVDDQGFDYMANSGREAKDRDMCGMLLAIIIMAFLTLSQYLGWY
ncbi:MAG: hypothetical protein JXR49_18945 [Acidobacteria bacterium]|nr:hypothetical protein [Acidobacteriota bacterium]